MGKVAVSFKSACGLCGWFEATHTVGHWNVCPECREGIALHGLEGWIDFCLQEVAAGRLIHPADEPKSGDLFPSEDK